MARARIQVNAVTTDAVNVAIGTPVLLSNDDEGGENDYTWTLLDKPEGSAAVLSNISIENPQFTPDLEGTYQLRLVVNIGASSESTDTCAVSVLRVLDGQRIPAATETTEASAVKGWSLAVNRILNSNLDGMASGGPVIAAVTPGGLAGGVIVRVSGRTTVASRDVPTIAAATGSETAVRGLLGVLIDGVTPGVVTAGAVVLVRIFGVCPYTITGASTAGAPVYVGNTGFPSLTPGTYPRLIGSVLSSSGGLSRWLVQGRDYLAALARRETGPGEMRSPDATWADNGQTGAGPYGMQTSSTAATALIVPLKIYPGETLDRLVLDANQGSATALMVATLYKGTFTSSTSSAAITSPGTNGGFAWEPTFTGGLVLPAACAAGEKFWLAVTASGANGTARKLCGALAHCRPSA